MCYRLGAPPPARRAALRAARRHRLPHQAAEATLRAARAALAAMAEVLQMLAAVHAVVQARAR